MKIITKILFILALVSAATCLTACVSEQNGENSALQVSIIQPVTFHVCEMQTKTAFGQGRDGVYPTLWTSNDSAVKLALNYTEAAEAGIEPSQDFRTATFSAGIDASVTQAPYTFYAVSPASAARALSPSRKAWNITIPAVQTPLEGSVDESAQILAAASQPSDLVPSDVDIHFGHLTAYGRMSLANLELGDAKVQKIEITATTPLVGDWYWDCEEEHALTDNGASSTLTLVTSGTTDIWFACAPVDMSGEIAIFTVYTDNGALRKEVEFPEGRKFNAGRIAVFTVDMKNAEAVTAGEGDFKLLKDASELQAGDEIIIADLEGKYALGPKNTGGQTPYRQAVGISVANEIITSAGNATVLTLEEGKTSGTWALKASDGYLTTTSTKNSLSTSSSISASSSWTISITSEGEATIEAQSGNYNYIRYNYNKGTNIRFSAYGENSSLQDPVTVYRKESAPAISDDPVTEFSEYGLYLGSDKRTYVAGQDQYLRSYSFDGVQTFTIVNPSSKEQVEIIGYKKSYVKGDKVKITVNRRTGKQVSIAGKTYNMTVVKEEGPVVWLGNGNGNGFIIKK